jgi:hypothetical protein
MNKLVDPGMIVDPLDNPGQKILRDVNKPISGARALGLMDLLLVQYLNRLEGQLIWNKFFACRYNQCITNCPIVLQRFTNLIGAIQLGCYLGVSSIFHCGWFFSTTSPTSCSTMNVA